MSNIRRVISTGLVSSLAVLFAFVPLASAQYSTGGNATNVLVGGDLIYVVVNIELWGDGVWNDPTLAGRWESAIERVWNNEPSGSQVKYKCYRVQVDAVVAVSEPGRTGSSSEGLPGYHQIWVPEVAVGDLANAFSDYGLYFAGNNAEGAAYAEYDVNTAAEYYEQNAPEGLQSDGKGQVRGFVWDASDVGSDGQKAATFGTWPDTLHDSIVAHEFGHLMGVRHDSGACSDNVMSPSGNKENPREQVYPRNFRDIFDDMNLLCQWDMSMSYNLDSDPSINYHPRTVEATNNFQLKEEEAPLGFIFSSSEESTIAYDSIAPELTCNTIEWETHNGTISYEGELLYNTTKDLETGGRMFMYSSIGTEPHEEVKAIFGCGRPNPYDLEGATTIMHSNVLYGVNGTNLSVQPYDNKNADLENTCAMSAEQNIVEEFYRDGIVVNGATEGRMSENFPEADLYGAKINFSVEVKDAQPLFE